ncbi:MAG: hypothetical protein QXU18_11270 [Thermoplasmatales archaeon]
MRAEEIRMHKKYKGQKKGKEEVRYVNWMDKDRYVLTFSSDSTKNLKPLPRMLVKNFAKWAVEEVRE